MAASNLQSDKLWAITSYFNPMGYQRRQENYRIFRSHLAVPLVTVELSFGGPFELAAGDADILIQRRGGDVMWQKERLLNLALSALPGSCEQIVSVDCDVVFQRSDWMNEVTRRLDVMPLLQPFSRAYHLTADMPPEDFDAHQPLNQQESTTAVVSKGCPPDACIGRALHRGPGSRASGFAWAVRRDVIEQHGYYDACIVGGGDSAMVCAAYGIFGRVMEFHAMNEWQQHRYRTWAEPFHESVRGRVACVEGDLLHLWHGDLCDRRTQHRHVGLGQFDFDPFRDIAVNRQGTWQWASDKPALHQFLKNYFAARHEDGTPAPACELLQ